MKTALGPRTAELIRMAQRVSEPAVAASPLPVEARPVSDFSGSVTAENHLAGELRSKAPAPSASLGWSETPSVSTALVAERLGSLRTPLVSAFPQGQGDPAAVTAWLEGKISSYLVAAPNTPLAEGTRQMLQRSIQFGAPLSDARVNPLPRTAQGVDLDLVFRAISSALAELQASVKTGPASLDETQVKEQLHAALANVPAAAADLQNRRDASVPNQARPAAPSSAPAEPVAPVPFSNVATSRLNLLVQTLLTTQAPYLRSKADPAELVQWLGALMLPYLNSPQDSAMEVGSFAAVTNAIKEGHPYADPGVQAVPTAPAGVDVDVIFLALRAQLSQVARSSPLTEGELESAVKQALAATPAAAADLQRRRDTNRASPNAS